ncbi:unnamed protein product [Symbiodinium sp. CCMP2592]|nr:unnamed protein product [Symbiodinium sp. CCMP2592]
MQVSAFVRYGLDGTFVDDPHHESGVGFRRSIIDVNEFQIAKALLAEHTELLSQEVDSRHLFTMCMQFGHEETAAEMLRQGVPGCKVEAFHLGPYALQPKFIGEPLAVSLREGCACRLRWTTCRSCSWGFDPGSGVWMQDWYATVEDAQWFAQEAAARPLFRTIAEALRSGHGIPDSLTDSAKARVLDIAVLVGDVNLVHRAKLIQRRPLRRWRWQDFIYMSKDLLVGWVQDGLDVREPDILEAALIAGNSFEGLEGGEAYYRTPLREAVALSGHPGPGLEFWNAVRDLLMPSSGQQSLGRYNNLISFLPRICDAHSAYEQVVAAKEAGLHVDQFGKCIVFLDCPSCQDAGSAVHLTLLDWSIYRGLAACAELCAGMDIGPSWWTAWLSTQDVALPCLKCGARLEVVFTGDDPAPREQRQAAAIASVRAALETSRQQASVEMGVGLFQSLRAWGRETAVSRGLLVRLTAQVLAFAAKRPAIFEDETLGSMLAR